MASTVSHHHIARVFPTECAVLVPPYSGAKPPPLDRACASLPLGAIVHATGPSALGALGTLTVIVHRFPWVVPSLTLPAGEQSLEPCLELVSDLRDRLAVVKRQDEAASGSASVVRAVRRRPPPSHHAMAQYVARRLGRPELEEPLADQFLEALEGMPASAKASIATYSRLFARHGGYSARHWRMIARLVHRLSWETREPCAGGSEAALPIARSRTANGYSRRFLGVPWFSAVQRVGWEWVLEGTLRTGGYLDRRPGGRG